MAEPITFTGLLGWLRPQRNRMIVLMVLALYHSAAMIMSRNLENSLADEAVKIASEEIENLRNYTTFSFTDGSSTVTVTRKVRNFNQIFNVVRTFVVYGGSAARTTVTVNWTYGGKSHSYQMVTVIADHG
jgi:hypothetical protein